MAARIRNVTFTKHPEMLVADDPRRLQAVADAVTAIMAQAVACVGRSWRGPCQAAVSADLPGLSTGP